MCVACKAPWWLIQVVPASLTHLLMLTQQGLYVCVLKVTAVTW
jgi:hypothetical protein